MTDILRQKLIKLVRGEEGVALVVTLALFMFLYVSCAGVYTIGKAVKDRIILQNAVDAAAYSAAVVQADYLSRIATINRAMAWNYAQFLKCQKSWIAVHFFKKVRANALTYNRTGIKYGVIDVVRGKGSLDTLPVSIPEEVNEYADSDDHASDITMYYERLESQRDALQKLRNNMRTAVRRAVDDVLQVNLPFRLGALCRRRVEVKDILEEMSSEEDEEAFLNIADANADLDIRAYPWFEFSDDGGPFSRDVLLPGKLSAGWETSQDNMHWVGRSVDAKSDKIAEKVPCYGEGASPLKIVGNYFSTDIGGIVKPAEGAITVAVAKWNENPWKGLLRDLAGIHAAFDYADKNDWTFVLASAQAGYRNSSDSKLLEYSLNKDDFDFVKYGKINESDFEYQGQDWDAVYLPVRKAFADDDTFKGWLEKDTGDDRWDSVVSGDGRKYVDEPLEGIRFYELNHAALPRMHNNGGAAKILNWKGDGMHRFLDLMYH